MQLKKFLVQELVFLLASFLRICTYPYLVPLAKSTQVTERLLCIALDVKEMGQLKVLVVDLVKTSRKSARRGG